VAVAQKTLRLRLEQELLAKVMLVVMAALDKVVVAAVLAQ
jgi:hypothetical protein